VGIGAGKPTHWLRYAGPWKGRWCGGSGGARSEPTRNVKESLLIVPRYLITFIVRRLDDTTGLRTGEPGHVVYCSCRREVKLS